MPLARALKDEYKNYVKQKNPANCKISLSKIKFIAFKFVTKNIYICLEIIKEVSLLLAIKSGGKNKIGLNAMVSNYKLASTIGHELIHAIDHVSGLYSGWYNKYEAAGANALSEIKAHNFQQGSPYNYNPALHNHFINLASQNGWKF